LWEAEFWAKRRILGGLMIYEQARGVRITSSFFDDQIKK
jgi:hypothetical protein